MASLASIDPFEWVMAAELLLQAISEERATLAWLPNFAFNLLAERVRESEMEGISLESIRMFINCSEPVAESHRKFIDRFLKYGVRNDMFAACYAMAETTFAVTQTKPGQSTRTLPVDRDALAKGIVAAADGSALQRICVSSGKPISDCIVRVVNEEGRDMPNGTIGELVIRSRSLFDGYRNNPKETSAVLRDAWYCSGISDSSGRASTTL